MNALPQRPSRPTSLSSRLPKYQKTLRLLLEEDVVRVSSSVLAGKMGTTPSQVRRDLSQMGEKGRNGYGYFVRSLYGRVCKLLGLGDAYSAAVIGEGAPAEVIASEPLLSRCGVAFRGVFPAKSAGELLAFCRQTRPDILILLDPVAGETDLPSLAGEGIKGILNLSGKELPENAGLLVENLIPADSLMLLCRRIKTREENEKNEKKAKKE